MTYWFSQRFFSLLIAVYVFTCLSFELNLVNHLKTLLNLFLVFFCSIFCHEVTDVDKNMSVNSRVISSKYMTHRRSIHVYSHILKSEVVLSVPLIVSVLLIFFEARQVYAWNKISNFLGDAEHVKLMIQRWLAVVGVCVALGDADTCTVGPWDCVRGSWTGKLTALTRWLQTWETPQGMVYLAQSWCFGLSLVTGFSCIFAYCSKVEVNFHEELGEVKDFVVFFSSSLDDLEVDNGSGGVSDRSHVHYRPLSSSEAMASSRDGLDLPTSLPPKVFDPVSVWIVFLLSKSLKLWEKRLKLKEKDEFPAGSPSLSRDHSHWIVKLKLGVAELGTCHGKKVSIRDLPQL